jgi:hypothetical protein
MAASRRAPAQPAGPAARLGVRRLLAAASLEPPGLAPAAILLVRSVSDPLPGRLRPHAAALRAPPEWEAAVRATLAERLRAAARPARGAVPETAAAVLFADQAEVLAAFARDAAAGVARTRWWWAALLRGLPEGESARLTALWARDARYVPAALEHLVAWGAAERVAAALRVDEATRILAAVAHACEAIALLSAPSAPTAAASPEAPRRAPGTRGGREARGSGAHDRGTSGSAPPAPPWEWVMPAALVPRALAPEQRALLGVGLALHRAPLIARSPAFAAAFVRWRAAAAEDGGVSAADVPVHRSPDEARAHESEGSGSAAVDATGPARRSPGQQPERRLAEPDGVRGHVPDPAPGAAPRSPAPTRLHPSGDPHAGGAAHLPQVDPQALAFDAAPGSLNPVGASEAGPPSAPIVTSAPPADADRDTAEAGEIRPHANGAGNVTADPRTENPPSDADIRRWSPSVEAEETYSALCGVFYLVNVVRAIDFFGALDAHFQVRSVVGGWGWIELLARALLGPTACVGDDPVWRILATLDGREPGTAAGRGFVAPAVRSLPEAWARLVPGDEPGAPEPCTPLGPLPPAALRRFLGLVVPFVRLRIAAALATAGADEPLETAVFRRIGLVQVTRSHVDVRMELDQVSVPVRLAGLDASPGWVPALGRVVTFHFH